MPIKPRQLERLLQSKFAFTIAKQHSVDHRWYELRLPGLPPIRTKVSHGNKEISRRLEAAIARQLRVRRTFYQGMVSCTNSREAYYQQVQEDPFPPFDIPI